MAEEKKNIPKLRFREFTGDNANAWELRKLGLLASFTKGNGYSKKDLVQDSNQTPIILYGSLYTNYKTNIEKVDTFARVKDKTIYSSGNDVVVPASGESAEDISRASAILKKGIILGGDLNIIHPLPDLNAIFLAITISNGTQKRELSRRAQGKSVVHLRNQDLKQVNLLYPNLEEQQKIGSFFKHLDELITLHQRMLDEYKTLKKTMLSKIFPKNGEKYPELRFFGFTDAWELRKLGDIGSVAMNKRVFKHQTSDNGEIPFFKIGTFGGKADTFISRKLFEEYKRKYPYPNKGDILLSASGSIGKIVVYTGEDEYFQDSNIVWFKHDGKINNQFLKQFYTIVKWDGLEGSTIKRLYNKNILNTNILLPAIREQEKIGTFFKHLDSLITLHQRELELLKTLKKTMLQQMFV